MGNEFENECPICGRRLNSDPKLAPDPNCQCLKEN